jgi:hypothetical protein
MCAPFRKAGLRAEVPGPGTNAAHPAFVKTTSSPKKADGFLKQGSRKLSSRGSGRSDAGDYPSGDEEDREGYVGPDNRGRPRTEKSVGLKPKS